MLMLKSINDINFRLNELAYFMNILQLVIKLSYHWAVKINIIMIITKILRTVFTGILEGSYNVLYLKVLY